jgi:hypothetical protein
MIPDTILNKSKAYEFYMELNGRLSRAVVELHFQCGVSEGEGTSYTTFCCRLGLLVYYKGF